MRKHHIDYAKGFGMLAVVWGHIMLRGWSYQLVYGFSIPLFFFLSGYVFNRDKYPDLRRFAAARFPRLIYPYVFFSLATWPVWIAYTRLLASPPENGYWGPLLQTLIAQGSSKYLVHNTPLWFVPCLLVVELAYFPMRHWSAKRRIGAGLILAVLGYFMIQDNGFFDFRKLPYSLEAAASAMIFYISGVLVRERFGMDRVSRIPKARPGKTIALIAVLTGCLLVLTSYNGHVTLGSNDLGKNVFVFYLAAWIGIGAILLTASLLEKWETGWLELPCRYLRYIGQYSFYFMAVHLPVKRIVVALLARQLDVKTRIVQRSMKLSLVAFLISLALSTAIVQGIVLFRKKRKT